MAIDINWITGEISVPQADLTLISGSFYELDSNAFRKEIMDKYAAEEGGPYPTPFEHNGEVTIAGVTYARQILIKDAYYFVTFEDLQYRVRIIGSNNNIHEVATINQVSVEPGNSAGLIGGQSGIPANIVRIRDSEDAAIRLEKGVSGNVYATVAGSPTTTSIPTSGCSPAHSATVANQFKSKVLTFNEDTITVALRGQVTDVSASTAAADPVLTVTALTATPVVGDTFTLS